MFLAKIPKFRGPSSKIPYSAREITYIGVFSLSSAIKIYPQQLTIILRIGFLPRKNSHGVMIIVQPRWPGDLGMGNDHKFCEQHFYFSANEVSEKNIRLQLKEHIDKTTRRHVDPNEVKFILSIRNIFLHKYFNLNWLYWKPEVWNAFWT